MYHEIERKFLVKKMPNVKGMEKVHQERYFLQRGDLLEEEIKKKRSVCYYERKITISSHEKSREKRAIPEETFKALQSRGKGVIENDAYKVSSKHPVISIKTYQGTYKDLVLAEVKFDTVEEMEDFRPLDWMGAEITDTKLGNDARLVDLDREHFKRELQSIVDNYNFKGMDGAL